MCKDSLIIVFSFLCLNCVSPHEEPEPTVNNPPGDNAPVGTFVVDDMRVNGERVPWSLWECAFDDEFKIEKDEDGYAWVFLDLGIKQCKPADLKNKFLLEENSSNAMNFALPPTYEVKRYTQSTVGENVYRIDPSRDTFIFTVSGKTEQYPTYTITIRRRID